MDEVVTFTRIVPATETMFFIPSFPLSGASIDLYFSTSQYYDSAAGGSGQPVTNYLSCVRASAAYAKTVAGTLTSFAVNTLRITDLGLLVEDTRTNSRTQSQDFTDVANWNLVTNITITGDTTAAPDGTTTADSLVPTATLGEHSVGSATVTGSVASWTASCYFKPNGYNWGTIGFNDGTTDSIWVFDLVAGTSTRTDFGSAPTGVTVVFETLANGWVRPAITLTAAVAFIVYKVGVMDQSTYHNFSGNTTSGIYAWGAQLELGAFSSSYIPTTGVGPVARATDAVLCIGNADTILRTLPHTSVVNIISLASPTAQTILGDDTDGPVDLYTNSENNRAGSFMAGIGLASSVFPTSLFTTGVKVGTAVATSARSVAGDGGTVSTDTNAAAGLTGFIYLGSGAPSFRSWNGYIRRLTIWNSKLADATLQGFTT